MPNDEQFCWHKEWDENGICKACGQRCAVTIEGLPPRQDSGRSAANMRAVPLAATKEAKAPNDELKKELAALTCGPCRVGVPLGEDGWHYSSEEGANKGMGGTPCISKAAELLAVIVREKEQAYTDGMNRMLDMVRASLAYPNGGGDIVVMSAIDRIVEQAVAGMRLEAARLVEGTCDPDSVVEPDGLCDMGIYPAAVSGYNDERDYKERDGYKNGWNAAVKEFVHIAFTIAKNIRSLPSSAADRGVAAIRSQGLLLAAEICDGYKREGDPMGKEYANETADELAARIRKRADLERQKEQR